MSSLKEIKGRIASVKSTQKITSAMKMVASAKLRKAQSQIERFLPYEHRLATILAHFLSSETEFASDLSEKRDVKRLAVVVFSSNSSLCGAFNSNILRLFQQVREQYAGVSDADIVVYPVGKKIEEAISKLPRKYHLQGSYIPLMDNPNFDGARAIADQLISDFRLKRIDCVELLYNHLKNTAVQLPTIQRFLPIAPDENLHKTTALSIDYIVEPDKKTVLEALMPKSLRIKIYAALLDSAAAEQAARMVAMQVATDNADEILEELTIQFNKQRQQSITGELLDIIGGSEALK
ncbi:MAG: F0F1 ATP synthase subunit gamma [Dysgonamonadaceae bacterium]|jgi:F-type H+-transporting ATPase subunit gamma|nr:F0F1 ATP synthase subunit gamma [Dysgonamonadaceae bacterium]